MTFEKENQVLTTEKGKIVFVITAVCLVAIVFVSIYAFQERAKAIASSVNAIDAILTRYSEQDVNGTKMVRTWDSHGCGIYFLSDFAVEAMIGYLRNDGFSISMYDSSYLTAAEGIPYSVLSSDMQPGWLNTQGMLRAVGRDNFKILKIDRQGNFVGEIEVYPFDNGNIVLLLSEEQSSQASIRRQVQLGPD